MTTPFNKLPTPATPFWIVRDVGSTVEVVHVGPISDDDLASLIDKISREFHGRGARITVLSGRTATRDVGVRIEEADSDGIWRTLLELFEREKLNTAELHLGINRVQYIHLSKLISKKG